MATTFFLKSPENKDGTRLIIAQITFNGIKISYSSKISIPTGEWIEKKQRVKPTYRGFFDINNYLDKINKESRTISPGLRWRG